MHEVSEALQTHHSTLPEYVDAQKALRRFYDHFLAIPRDEVQYQILIQPLNSRP